MRLESLLEHHSYALELFGNDCEYGCPEVKMKKMIQKAKSGHPHKNVCAVKDWISWDLDVKGLALQRCNHLGVSPCMLFAHHVIKIQAKKISLGSYARSSILVDFTDDCLFVTKNIVYVLVGKGYRKTVTTNEINSIWR